jgi:hypothetical protein
MVIAGQIIDKETMRTKIVTFLIFFWAAAALCLPVVAILSFGQAPKGLSEGACSRNWGIWLNLWHNKPGIWFTGMRDLCAARILGELTWQIGVIGIPLFLIPIGLRLTTGGRAFLVEMGRQRNWSGSTVKARVKSYSIVLFCIACSCYYIYLGYFSPGPIYLHSGMGAAVIVLGISFGPALIILLSSGLAANVLFLISPRNQGVSDE